MIYVFLICIDPKEKKGTPYKNAEDCYLGTLGVAIDEDPKATIVDDEEPGAAIDDEDLLRLAR